MVCKALRISPQCQHSPQAASSGRHQRCFCQVEASISIGTSAIELQDAALPTTRSRCRQPRPAEEDVNDQQAERSKAGLIFPCRPWPCQRQSGLPSRLGVRPKRKVRGPPTRRCAFHVVCRLGGPARRARCCQRRWSSHRRRVSNAATGGVRPHAPGRQASHVCAFGS